MAQLRAFIFQSLDGFYCDAHGSTQWHEHGEEGANYSEAQMKKENILLFGRRTYEMMQSFWPTEAAANLFPKVAKGMNAAEKWVVSNSLSEVSWKNTELISGDVITELTTRKRNSEKDITVLGSASLIRQLKEADLLDELEVWVDPLVLGRGRTIFEGTEDFVIFELQALQQFSQSGATLFTYKLRR